MIKPLRAHKNNLDNLGTSVSDSQLGSRLLVSGQELDMWLWQAMPTPENDGEQTYISQDCEVMGYVIAGRAELHVDSKAIELKPGDSWVVPTGALHFYRILEPLTALKTSHPPAGQIY